MKNDPWLNTLAVWGIVCLLTAYTVFRVTLPDMHAFVRADGEKGRDAEKSLAKEVPKGTERDNEGKIIVLKSSVGGALTQAVFRSDDPLRVSEEMKETEENRQNADLNVFNTDEESNAAEPETAETREEMTETAFDGETAPNGTEAETEETAAQITAEGQEIESAAERETGKADEPVSTVFSGTAPVSYTCTFNCNINRSGRWNAGDEDCFTLEVFGTGSDEAFSVEYFSYDTNKIDALYQNGLEQDAAHASELSSQFGGNHGVISYRCSGNDGVRYINVLPNDGIIALEGNAEAGMRFYTGEGYGEDILTNYEKAVSDGFTDGNETVLQ